VKGFTKGAFHWSELAGRTIARPVNLKMKWRFPRVFAEKPSPLMNTIQDLTDLAGDFSRRIKREILIATRMVWPVTSDKWKAP